ncbi:hypothetical protein RJ640_023139 [Escallonia rubra]|uniref:Late embryogenesis abundant protein LEA-2 subgroup domain-containing protein n=1 Tax=Escallonia rubra TaxID=112253 RepID=A0AA88S7H9_9ASTE|nr:hypothetical protein RJ640_023139 [Escallonia rubra]
MEMEKEKEKEQQQANPLAPANGHARSDQESANEISREARRKKRTKYIIYGIAFVIFQTIVMTIAALTIMKFRNPKFRVRSASFDSTFEVGTAASPTFNIHMNAVLGVKNNNFGPFKYRNTTVDFYYRDTREKSGKFQGTGVWKIPTGVADEVYI